MKHFFVEYLEDSPAGGLVVSRSPVLVHHCHFTRGPANRPECGFRRKRDRDAHIARLNAAAGRIVAQPLTPIP